MTARRENRSRSLARLWRLGPARSRGCSPRAPMHPRYRPSARQYAAPLGSPVPWSRIRYAHTLPLAGASLIAGVRVVPCTAASWAGSSHSSRPFGPVRWLPWPGIRPAQRPGGGVACRGPAGPRRRVPVWPSSAPRVGPRAAMRGGGCPHPPRYAQKIRTAGVSVPLGPALGAGRPVAPLGGFCARVPIRRHPLPPRLLVVVVGGSGFPPPAAGPAPRECRGREGFARSRPAAPSGLLPARFFLSRPLHSRWRAGFFPFALAVSCRSCSLHGGPPWAGRAALAGGPVYRRC